MTPRTAPRTDRTRSRSFTRRALAGVMALLLLSAVPSLAMPSAFGASYTRIVGDGSSWAGNALSQWQADVKSQGVTVDYTPDGASTGRKVFAQGLTDFAVSEIPYTGDTADPQDALTPNFDYSLMPAVAGGTSFMYNLQVNGQRFEQLQLSQAAIAGIFAGQITTWNDPIIAATNPGVALPAQQITVVVRSDGSGATAEFTLWMLHQFPSAWAALCAKTGCDPNHATSYYPYQGLSNFVAQSQSVGVTSYTASTPYTINYDEYSYALGVNFPVVQVQNAAGFFVTPTSGNVAVALTQAEINGDKTSDNYLSQDLSHVYGYGDPRTYPVSAYSYLIVPAEVENNFDAAHGATLAFFSTYDLCEGQQSMGALGYSPLPMNLVLAAMDQVLKIPGVDTATQQLISDTKSGATSGSSNPCNNPTFKPGDDPAHNILVDTAPFPAGCDAACQAPWKLASAGTNSGVGGKANNNGGKGGKGGNSSASADASDGATASSDSADGAGGTTTDGTTSTDPGQVVANAPTAAAPPSCDAVTGECTTTGTTTDTATASDTVPVSAPSVIGAEKTWGGPQLALAICVLLGLLLVAGPAVVSSQLDRRRGGGHP